MSSIKLTNIYILRLEEEKWYIGKTDTLEYRIIEHALSKGAVWTSKYRPIEIEKIFVNVSPYEEDRYVKEYMDLYGIQNVRGGSYCQLELTEEQKNILKREIYGANNRCYRCGRNNHFIRDCYAKYDRDGQILSDIKYCDRCNRSGHIIQECFATVNKEGNMVDDISFLKPT
jgi:hypothetical protein